MYCKWCGHYFYKNSVHYKSICLICYDRYLKYTNAKCLYKKTGKVKYLSRIESIQMEYKELAIQGFKVPGDMKGLI